MTVTGAGESDPVVSSDKADEVSLPVTQGSEQNDLQSEISKSDGAGSAAMETDTRSPDSTKYETSNPSPVSVTRETDPGKHEQSATPQAPVTPSHPSQSHTNTGPLPSVTTQKVV